MVLQVKVDICRWRGGEGRKHRCWRQQTQTRKKKGRGGEGLTHGAIEPTRATGTYTVLIDRLLRRRL